MNKYVFIASSLSNMGGAQMYIRNKVLYLKSKGWVVDVITAKEGKSVINELENYNKHKIELAFDIYCYCKKIKESVIEDLVEWINDASYDEIILESTCISECTWAEAIANRVKAKHFCFLLQEQNLLLNKGVQQFFLFKHKRRELAGIVDKSLSIMFAPFNPIPIEESYTLPAFCTNVEANVNHPLINCINKDQYDFIVGSLTRLDKPFVMSAIKDFCNYACNNSDKKFLLLLMGDAPKGSHFVKNITQLLTMKNVDYRITGYLYPVPIRLLELCDVFFTSAGSSWTCVRSGVPTIVYDGNDFRPIGILKRTTSSYLFRGLNEPVQNFSDLMDQILVEKRFPREMPCYDMRIPDFKSHLDFISHSSNDEMYYPVELIKPDSLSDWKLSVLLGLLGPSRYLSLGNFKKKVMEKSTSDR